MVNNKKNLFQQMFGLVKFHIFSFFFFRFFKVIIKKYIRRINSFLSFFIGYNIANILDAFSVGSVFLIFFKLFFRIVETNPSWEVNILVLLCGTVVSLKLELINSLRENLMLFWKITLGKRFYWLHKSNEPLDWQLSLQEITLTHEEELDLEGLPKDTFVNVVFQQIYFGLIAIRLAIINEIYLFIIFNIILTYFLVINKYLILSSLFTIIIVFAKFTFHLCDYTIKDFLKNIQPFVFQTAAESLKCNKENILFVGIFVSRMFYLEQKAKEEIYTQASKNFNEAVTSDYLFSKLKRIQHPLLERLSDFAKILSLNDKSHRRLATLLQGRMRIFFSESLPELFEKKQKNYLFFQNINICIIILLLCLFL